MKFGKLIGVLGVASAAVTAGSVWFGVKVKTHQAKKVQTEFLDRWNSVSLPRPNVETYQNTLDALDLKGRYEMLQLQTRSLMQTDESIKLLAKSAK